MPRANAAPVNANSKPDTSAESQRPENVLALRGTEQWKAWLDKFAASKGMPVTVFIDHALRELARRESYPDPPTRTA